MAGKRIKYEILLSAVAVLLFSGFGGVVVRPGLEPDQVLESRFGDVTWNHELHARLDDVAGCTVCHHQEQQSQMNPRPCHDCHERRSNQDALVTPDLFMDVEQVEYEGENGPPPRVAFHGRCIGCHRAMEQGPLVCRDCHAQRFSGTHGVVRWDHTAHARRYAMPEPVPTSDESPPLSETALPACVFCHHQDGDAVTEKDYRPCSACHEPAAVRGKGWTTEFDDHEDEVHGECHTCHVDFNPEDDPRTCKACHPTIDVDVEVERPTLEEAVHQRCMTCHDLDYVDLTAAMPVYCSDCHRPDPSWLEIPDVGVVLWNHDNHGRFGEEVDCDTCHHMDLPDEPHAACYRCHDDEKYDNPTVTEALETRCLDCHDEKENGLARWDAIALRLEGEELDAFEAGPAKIEAAEGDLWWNHRAHAIDYGFSCRSCHHGVLRKDGEFVTPGRAGLEDWPDEAARIQRCDTCHGEDGPVPGSPAEGSEAPALGEVYASICLECHQRIEGATQTWAGFFEEEQVRRSGIGPDQGGAP